MAVIVDTTPQISSTVAYNGRKILRTSNGTLWVIAVQVTDTVPRLRYSTDDGANWTTSSTAFSEAIDSRNAAWVFCSDGAIYMLYNRAANDEIRVRKGTLNGAHTDIAWSAATTVHTATYIEYFDLAVHEEGGDTIVHVVYADTGTLCEYRRAVWGSAFGSATTLATWTGTTAPKIEFNHTLADVTAVKDSAPHVYVSWFEDNKIMFRKAVYSSGPSWAWNAACTITLDAEGVTSFAMSFDGTDIVMMVESDGDRGALLVIGRDAADTTTTSLANTPTRTGTVTPFTDITYNSDRGVEVFHTDQTAKVLQRVIYDRSDSSWGSWATIDADADDLFPQVKIGYWSGSKADAVDLVWTDGTTSLYDIMHEWLVFNVAPTAPSWVAPADGSVQDIDETLLIDWTFEDPDVGDSQSAYTLRRRIGGAAYAYWNGTGWQAGEDASTKIASVNDEHTLATSWGADADADHYYTVKTWDAADLGPSPWAAELRVVPSVQDNPTLVTPAASAVVSAIEDVTWTVSTQTKYRSVVSDTSSTTDMDEGTLDWDSGVVVNAGSRTVEATFTTDGVTRYVRILTYNDEVLISDIDEHEVTVDFDSPPTPTLVATADTPIGAITVAVTNPAPSGGEVATVSNDLHRRVVGDSDDGIRVATGIAKNGSFVDWAVASGVAYEYRATAFSSINTSTQSSWTA